MPTHDEWGKLKFGAGIQHSVANYLENLIASFVTNTASLICFISTWRCWLVSLCCIRHAKQASKLALLLYESVACCVELISRRLLSSGLLFGRFSQTAWGRTFCLVQDVWSGSEYPSAQTAKGGEQWLSRECGALSSHLLPTSVYSLLTIYSDTCVGGSARRSACAKYGYQVPALLACGSSKSAYVV